MNIASIVTTEKHRHICGPNDTIHKALSQVTSSHEAVFVLDNQEQFLGIISPYQALYQNRLLHHAKVNSFLIHPPHLTTTTDLIETAGYMNSLRIYTLPVFDSNKKMVGHVTAKNLLAHVASDATLSKRLAQQVRWREPITTSSSKTAKEVYSLLKSKHIARVILVSEHDHLEGIVARSDLHFLVTTPGNRQRVRSKVRIPNVGGTVTKSKLTFNESALNEYQEPIKTMATTKVLTAGQNDNPISSLKKMIDSKINSIVRIDGQRRPTGFLSRSDFLSGLLRLKPSPQVPIMLSIKTPSLNEYYTLVCRWHTESYVEKSQKRWPAQKVSLRLKSAQNAAGKPSLFEVNLQYTLKNGQDFYAKAENHWYKQALIDAFKKLDKQLRRGG